MGIGIKHLFQMSLPNIIIMCFLSLNLYRFLRIRHFFIFEFPAPKTLKLFQKKNYNNNRPIFKYYNYTVQFWISEQYYGKLRKKNFAGKFKYSCKLINGESFFIFILALNFFRFCRAFFTFSSSQ